MTDLSRVYMVSSVPLPQNIHQQVRLHHIAALSIANEVAL